MDFFSWSARLVVVIPTVVLSLAAAAPAALAQQPARVDSTASLSDTLYQEETVGLSMRLPEGVTVTRNPQSMQRIIVETSDMAWVGTLEVIQTSNTEETLANVADRAIEANKSADNARTRDCKVRSRQSINIAGQPAEQFVLDMSFDANGGVMQEVRIYTIFKPQPDTFVLYSVRGDGARADSIIDITKKSVDTFRFRDPAAVSAELQQGIDATNKALAALTPERYRAMLIPDSWYRVYSREGGIDSEIAYYRIQEDIGERGLVGAIDKSQFTPAEAEQGLLVRQTARFISEFQGQPDYYVTEVESLAWMSFDRKSEVWSTKQVTYNRTPRGYTIARRSSISGGRQGGRIDVIISTNGVVESQPNFTSPDAYVSQAEQHLIYRIFNPGREGSYVMYVFRPQTGDVKRRSEIIKAASDPNRFTVESRQDPSLPAIIKTISAKGEILKMVAPEGQITEPTDPAQLQKLWRAKGLPTGTIHAVSDSTTANPGG